MSKGGSKLVTGIIAFLLGFIFAILVEVGAIFGVYWFVVNKDLDTVMATIGINNKDDDGNNIYINTDTENGGVSNLKELISGVKGLVFENGELAIVGKSFDDINHLIPATQKLLDAFYGIADDYIEIDHREFESNPLMNLAQVLSESVMNVKTAPLLEKLGVLGDDPNLLVKTLVMGSECDYAAVTYSDGRRDGELKLPVMYDYFMNSDGEYFRIDYSGNDANVEGYGGRFERLSEDWLCDAGTFEDNGTEYERKILYYVPCKVTQNGIEQADYSAGEVTKEDDNGKTYKFQPIEYGEDTVFIAVKPNDGKFTLDYAAISASTDDCSYDAQFARNYYYTEKDENERWLLKTYSGKNYFRDSENKLVQLDALTLYDIIADPFSPLDSILVADVMQGDSNIKKIFGTTTLGSLLRGEGIDEIINDLEVSTFLSDVSPSNKVMCYIAYKISDLQSNGDNTYTAVYDKDGEDEQIVTVKLDIDGRYIAEVVGADGSEIDGVKVKDVAALANNMPITVLMDVSVDEPIMAYLAYGVTGIKEQNVGEGFRYAGKINVGGEERECYIATEESGGSENITAVVYYDDEGNRVVVGGTKVNNVGDRVNGFADALTVGDVLNLDGSESPMLGAIKDTRLSQMANRIEELTVREVMDADKIEESAILRQLKDHKLTELTSAIDELYIQMVYAEEVYKVGKNAEPALATEYNAEWLYYVKEGEAFILDHTQADALTDETEKDDALGHLTEQQFNAGTFYTYGEAKGMWRLVLYKNGKEKAYTMNNFNNMVAACADSVNDATLSELAKAGVVNATDAQLNKKIKLVNQYVNADGELTSNESEGVTLGEMKLANLINLVVNHLLAE